MTLSGLVNLHKPPGTTSREAVDCVKRLVRPAKTGHAGTLDPLASGVLVVAVGAATRLIEYVQAMPKQYTGTFLLGRESDTEDIEGEVRLLDGAPVPEVSELRQAAVRFAGPIEQRPPVFSALKVQGKRAYDLARAGQRVELAPRIVTIHHLEVMRYEYPELVLDVECSSGTYIRSLGRDLAAAVGTAAVMANLVRTGIGSFRIEEAWRPADLAANDVAAWLLPARRAVESLPVIKFTDDQIARLANGLPVARPAHVSERLLTSDEAAAIDGDEQLAAIVVQRADGRLWPVRNLGPR